MNIGMKHRFHSLRIEGKKMFLDGIRIKSVSSYTLDTATTKEPFAKLILELNVLKKDIVAYSPEKRLDTAALVAPSAMAGKAMGRSVYIFKSNVVKPKSHIEVAGNRVEVTFIGEKDN